MNFTVVIVTFNRLECLKKALFSVEEQTHKPKNIIVVNNASTDGTYEFLENWRKEQKDFCKTIIHQSENTGGSGGFYTGLQAACDIDNEWIWLSDDDAYPDVNALYFANKYLTENDTMDISAICSKIINNGEIDTWHRRRLKKRLLKIEWENVDASEYVNTFELDLLSYVGCIINKSKLEDVGLTNKDYFIWYDDSEHSLRLREAGKIVCVPSIMTIHNVPVNSTINWKYYYAIRNYNDMIRKHFPKRYFYFSYISVTVHSLLRLINRDTRQQGMIALDALRDVKKGVLGKK